MDYSMKITDYNEFCKLVDNIIEGVENGTILSNPLKKEFTDLGDVVVAETAVERGEISREELEEVDLEINNIENLPKLDVTLIPNKTIILYNINTLQVVNVFNDAVQAQNSKGIHQTTCRNRSKAKYTDPTGVRWTYYYEGLFEEIGINLDKTEEDTTVESKKSYLKDL